jgi:hypothetical protein
MTDPSAYIVSSSSPFMRQRRLCEEEKYPLWTPFKRKESFDPAFLLRRTYSSHLRDLPLLDLRGLMPHDLPPTVTINKDIGKPEVKCS